MEKENWKGAGYVVLYQIAMDNSTRTAFCKDDDELETEVKKIKNLPEGIGAGIVSVFAVGNYCEPK